MSRGRFVCLAACIAAACTACTSSSDEHAIPDVPCIAGPVPQGINSYPLLQHVGNGRIDAVEDIFAQANALGRGIVRTPAFMDGGTNAARIRESDLRIREEGLVALDTLLEEARIAGVRLLLTLTNNWNNYGGAPAIVHAIDPELPKDAFWSDPRAIDAQLTYERALVGRVNSINGRAYAEDPTIFAWEIVNEARCTTDRLCNEETLVRWANMMASAIREAGAQQPIAWGGSGYTDRYGENLEAIAADGSVDMLTLHFYGTMAIPLPGESFASAAIRMGNQRIRERAELARDHSLPLILEEMGWKTDNDAERARVLAAWSITAIEEGVGTLPWMIGEQGREDYDGYLIRPEDTETIAVLGCD